MWVYQHEHDPVYTNLTEAVTKESELMQSKAVEMDIGYAKNNTTEASTAANQTEATWT